MKKLITALSLFCILVMHAQEKVHRISLVNEKNTAIESSFYVENVYDGRQLKGSIGTVYVSVFNSKVGAGFVKPFTEEIQSLLDVLYPKNESKKAISIRINQLYITEGISASDNKEKATSTVVLDIIETKKDGKQYITGTFFATKEATKIDATKLHSELIIAAIKNAFENYKNSKQAYSLPILFNPEEVLENKKLKNEIPMGVYLNYQDVINGHFLNLEDYTITKYQDGFCLLDKKTGRLESGFYGFSDGAKFYLNLFQFSALKYYFKAEIINNDYFIDEIYEQSIDFSSFRSAYAGNFGAGGALAMMMIYGADNDNTTPKKIPLIIERLTGVPTLLTDKNVLKLLESNEVLKKEYKKTKRTPADKKMIYKKLKNL